MDVDEIPQSEWLPAMQELLSGHDNLYVAHWGHIPNCDPKDDIAAKAARAIIERLTPEVPLTEQECEDIKRRWNNAYGQQTWTEWFLGRKR